jgi:RNA polymerase sigma factor (sigma-70 family)
VLVSSSRPGVPVLEIGAGMTRGRAQAQDASASARIASLFDTHVDEIRGFLFRRTGEWSTADDLTSIVFLEAWRRRSAEVPAESERAWLYGIATNVARNQWRARRRHSAALTRLSAERDDHGFSDDVDTRLDDEAQMRALLPRFRRLSRSEQDVLSLCVWSELTYEEAAAALGIPVGTVRSRLARARTRLREPDSAPRTSSQ